MFQSILFGQSVAQLVCMRKRSLPHFFVTEVKVGGAHSLIRQGQIWIEFDGSLIEFERSCNIAGVVEFGPLSACLQRFERRTEHLFKRLIEAAPLNLRALLASREGVLL